MGRTNRPVKMCNHNAKEPVKVGPYKVWLSGLRYYGDIPPATRREIDILVALEVPFPTSVWMKTGKGTKGKGKGTKRKGKGAQGKLVQAKLAWGADLPVMKIPMVDFGGVPENWRGILEDRVIPELESGKNLLVFCVGSHGRTGTFLASLIALLEPEVDDPIAAVRKRHCKRAVETYEQADGIFALKGVNVPEEYDSLLVDWGDWGDWGDSPVPWKEFYSPKEGS